MDYLQDDEAVSVRHWCSRTGLVRTKSLVITPTEPREIVARESPSEEQGAAWWFRKGPYYEI